MKRLSLPVFLMVLSSASFVFAFILDRYYFDPGTAEKGQTEVMTGTVIVGPTSYWVEVQETRRAYSDSYNDVIIKMWRMENNNFPSFIAASGTTFQNETHWGSVEVINPENTACAKFPAVSSVPQPEICENAVLSADPPSNFPLFALSMGTRATAIYFLYQGAYAVMPNMNPN